MSHLDELIKALCPSGVNFIEINQLINRKDIVIISAPQKVLKKKYKEEGQIPVIDQGQEEISGFSDDEKARIPKNEYIVFGDHTECLKFINFSFAQGADGIKIIKINHLKLNSKYLYYAIYSKYKKTGSYKRHFSILKKLEIPIPPLPIQEEIVRILDTFTELTAELTVELTAELTARKKKYEYYRDKLLTFDDSVEYLKLNDLCLKTNNINWNNNKSSNYIYIDLSSVDRETKTIIETIEINYEDAPSRAKKIVNTKDVLLGTTRPLLKRYCYITSEYNNQICSTGFCVLRANENKVLSKYLYYQISTKAFFNYAEINQKGSAYPAISDLVVKQFKIPVPPLAEQERIVKILDKFDTLTNDISKGLPAEIEARQKQYEYYRDKLLTFKEKKI